jgi:hypothetical protein
MKIFLLLLFYPQHQVKWIIFSLTSTHKHLCTVSKHRKSTATILFTKHITVRFTVSEVSIKSKKSEQHVQTQQVQMAIAKILYK